YRDGDISRKGGVDIRVDGSAVAAQIENGALLGPCSRTEPEDIYWIMRSTAQDMSVRADNGTGATLQVFDEIGYSGFDFDSGFGFVDAKRALRKFLKQENSHGWWDDDHHGWWW
ncbi:MAG: hypothetical protein R3C58_14800, partial [Parvularculaceae bacterium]